VLDAINRRAAGKAPWRITFSYGRALQQASLRTWNAQEANVPAAQAALFKRAKLNGLAALGKYDAEMEKTTALA
jgi:fructose-bisphosphate aldolase class I